MAGLALPALPDAIAGQMTAVGLEDDVYVEFIKGGVDDLMEDEDVTDKAQAINELLEGYGLTSDDPGVDMPAILAQWWLESRQKADTALVEERLRQLEEKQAALNAALSAAVVSDQRIGSSRAMRYTSEGAVRDIYHGVCVRVCVFACLQHRGQKTVGWELR